MDIVETLFFCFTKLALEMLFFNLILHCFHFWRHWYCSSLCEQQVFFLPAQLWYCSIPCIHKALQYPLHTSGTLGSISTQFFYWFSTRLSNWFSTLFSKYLIQTRYSTYRVTFLLAGHQFSKYRSHFTWPIIYLSVRGCKGILNSANNKLIKRSIYSL